jgi:small subunit ribosomal protein S20
MANIKSAKKRILTNELARKRNASVRSQLKTLSKNTEAAIEAKDAEKINLYLPQVLRGIDRAAKNGVIHANSAARKKSHFQHLAALALKG